MAAPPIIERHKPHFHRKAPVLESVRLAATGNVAVPGDIGVGDTIDGGTIAAGERILLPAQTDASENGIYVDGVRDYDQSTDDPGFGFLVYIREGATNGGTIFANTNTSAPVIGTDDITFEQFSGGGGGGASPTDTAAWIPLSDGAGGVIYDAGTDQIIVAFTPI